MTPIRCDVEPTDEDYDVDPWPDELAELSAGDAAPGSAARVYAKMRSMQERIEKLERALALFDPL